MAATSKIARPPPAQSVNAKKTAMSRVQVAAISASTPNCSSASAWVCLAA
jgi:hypothetical protein